MLGSLKVREIGEMYEVLSGYLSADRTARRVIKGAQTELERFQNAVACAEAAHRAGNVPNVDYKSIKGIMDGAIDTAVDAIRGKYINGGRYEQLPPAALDFYRKVDTVCPYLHTIPGRLAKAQKLATDHPYCNDLMALLTDLIPLVNLFAALSKMVVKRTQKPAEEVVVGYTSPPVTNEYQQQVVTLLEKVTQAKYDHFKTLLIRSFQDYLDEYMTAQALSAEVLSPHKHFISGRTKSHRNFDAYDMVTLVTEQIVVAGRTTGYKVMGGDLVVAIFTKKATETADHIRRHFVYKNFRKIASIIEAKGGCKTAREMEHSVSLGGMRGVLHFSFPDTSHFMVVNEVVFVINSYGTRFYRFPLTFRNVIMPNGKPMGRPSEERMNTVFVGKT